MNRYVIKDQEKYNSGEVVQAFDTKSFTMLQVQKDTNGKMCQVIGKQQAYTQVHLCFTGASVLNLSSENTQELVKTGKLACIEYRSSGALDNNGKIMPLKDQIEKGLARKIEVVAWLKDGFNVGATTEDAYEIHINADSSNKLVPLE